MKNIILILSGLFILFANTSAAVPAPQEMIDEINKKLFAHVTIDARAVDDADFEEYVDLIKKGLPFPDPTPNNPPLSDDVLLTKLQSSNLPERLQASKIIKSRGFRNKDLFISVFQKILSEDDFQVRKNILDGINKRILGLRNLELTAPISSSDSETDRKVRASVNPEELSELTILLASVSKNLRVQDPALRAASIYTFLILNPNGYMEVLDLINDPAKEVRLAVIGSFAEIAALIDRIRSTDRAQ